MVSDRQLDGIERGPPARGNALRRAIIASISAPVLGGHVISKPFGQCVGVGNGCFPKAESNANLGTYPLGRAACQECFTI